MKHADFVMVGGGLASATAAETLRTEGADGSILIVSAESELPYHRPPLSKHFLVSDMPLKSLSVLDAAYYRDSGIEVMRNAHVTRVDVAEQTILTDQGETIRYGKLLIATGARPTRLDVPGSTLPGIYYLRTVSDALAIKEAAATAKRVVVVGGSFMGIELAASLRKKGIEVTLLVKERALFEKLDAWQISDYARQVYLQHGVELIFGDGVAEFRGHDRLTAVVTEHGRKLPCDFVAMGVGVVPDVDFLHGSGIKVENGVVVDRYLQTDRPNVFAAGDVACFFDPVFNKRRRVEHWDNAIKQGRLAAKNMLGRRQPYDEVSYFFGDIFDIGFQFFGATEEARERVEIGSFEAKSYALLYMKGNVPRAIFTTGRPAKETRSIESLIRYRVNIDRIKTRLADPGFLLERMPRQTVLILQGGGALGAFECGVVKALEEKSIYPDIVAGVSSGAFNGAIIASNPRHAAAALSAFWQDVSTYTLDIPNELIRRTLSAWQTVLFGVPGFFRPRWWNPAVLFTGVPYFWNSFYELTPARQLLLKYVDFERLKSSPVRLLVSAVNVETARLEVFDSYVDDLTPDHILASGSLPPGFSWTTIGDKHYWDGGIVSNSPLEQVVDRCGTSGRRAYIVDLFPNRKPLPTNIVEVLGRRDEIVYTERLRNDSDVHTLVSDFRKLVEEILGRMEPELAEKLKQRPRYVQLMGDETKMEITRITRPGTERELPSKDYDFSRTSINMLERSGYEVTKKILAQRTESPAAAQENVVRPAVTSRKRVAILKGH